MAQRRITISDEFLFQLLKTGKSRSYEVIDGLPEGAKLIHAEIGFPGYIYLFYESEKWEQPETLGHGSLTGPPEGSAFGIQEHDIKCRVWRLPGGEETLEGEILRALKHCYPDRWELLAAELAKRLEQAKEGKDG